MAMSDRSDLILVGFWPGIALPSSEDTFSHPKVAPPPLEVVHFHHEVVIFLQGQSTFRSDFPLV